MQRRHEQQGADHGEEDHQRGLGESEEAATGLFGGLCGGFAPGCVQHFVAIMTQAGPPRRSTPFLGPAVHLEGV